MNAPRRASRGAAGASPGSAPEIEVVVARYREALRWTRNLPPTVAVTVYNKGEPLDAHAMRGVAIPVSNVGLEAHSYLQHIVQRWDTLAPLTFFVQGHPFDHAHDLHAVVRKAASGAPPATPFAWLGFIIDTDDARGRRLFVPWSKNHDRRELRLDAFCQTLFGEPAGARVIFQPGAQFAVRAEIIRARPRAFYERALALSLDFPDAAHCFERTWDRVFGVRGVDPAALGDAPCVYLKPIRRHRDAAALAGPERISQIMYAESAGLARAKQLV